MKALELHGSERTVVKDLFDPTVETEVTENGVEHELIDTKNFQRFQKMKCCSLYPLNDVTLNEWKGHIDALGHDELGSSRSLTGFSLCSGAYTGWDGVKHFIPLHIQMLVFWNISKSLSNYFDI